MQLRVGDTIQATNCHTEIEAILQMELLEATAMHTAVVLGQMLQVGDQQVALRSSVPSGPQGPPSEREVHLLI